MNVNHLDMINGTFEFIGAIVSWRNVYQIYKDKFIAGVYWPATAFFGLWGLWNIFYYSGLNQTWSFCSGILLCLANLTWVSLYLYYRFFHGRT